MLEMHDMHETYHARKTRLRQSFLAQLPERIRQARVELARLAPGADNQAALANLQRLLHTLRGTGASFGFADIARDAEAAEHILHRLIAAGGQIDTAELADLAARIDTLEHQHSQPAAREIPEPPASLRVPASAAASAAGPSSVRDRRLVYLCDDDADLAQQIAHQLTAFGYRVDSFHQLTDLRAAVECQVPAAIVMDVIFPEGEHAGPEFLTALNQYRTPPIPSVFISCRDDFAARLRGVQAGGSAFCAKPIKTPELVEVLDLITNQVPPEPFHILIVDDDPDIAQLHAMALEEAGMVTQILSEPERVLSLLDNFRADLVLMDLYMPRCSGPELASVLRQIPGYLSLPIIYVSAETDAARQFQALQVGADGFLTKPIDPMRLVMEVQMRAERMRNLRALMVRDSLTGLFNHNTILQFLELAVASARRNLTSLCFAMIDVDHFKAVNDRHGHAAGDQVLLALSRTLRLRLRDSDLVGRYGGEEFAVVLNGLDLDSAEQILDHLRDSFSTVVFVSGGAEFCCTFSVGLAAFPDCTDARMLTEAADRALYLAKQAGRNRVATLTSFPF